jgi:hypothetical protein
MAHGIMKRAWLAVTLIRFWAGKVLNAIGVPGVVQPGTYESGIGPTSVRVTVGPLFTVVSVNGVDVYLHRLTGAIDGVGYSVATPVSQPDWPARQEEWSQPRSAPPQPSFADTP